MGLRLQRIHVLGLPRTSTAARSFSSRRCSWVVSSSTATLVLLNEHICLSDMKDRTLVAVPGVARIRGCFQMATPGGVLTWCDPTPLEWLRFEIRLGAVKYASY